MKPNWVCSECGMWSSRKYSVKRHIANKHYGNAYLVSYIDYLVGRQSGLYPASSFPTYENKENNLKNSFGIVWEEFWKEKARLAARGNSNF
jgi:hypothetical protein